MLKRNIVVIEDDDDLLDLTSRVLEKNGYNVSSFKLGEDALQSILENKPDLILMDLMLPDISGLDLCKRLKKNENRWEIPIIILTARSHELDILLGFEVGADDYITKPFNEKILLARIKSAINREKRKNDVQNSIIKFDDLFINPEHFEVSVNNKIISLTCSEFRILHVLALKPGYVFSRYQLVESIKGDDYTVNDRSIDVLLGRLRKKLGVCCKHIETVYGVGYRFIE